jgi:hypothetical protein
MLDEFEVERPPVVRFRSPASDEAASPGGLIDISIEFTGGEPAGPVVLSSAIGFERAFTEPPYTTALRVPSTLRESELRLRVTTRDALGRPVESALALPIDRTRQAQDRDPGAGVPPLPSGRFAPTPLVTAVDTTPVQAAAGDLNLDGVLDLAVVHGPHSHVSVLVGRGDGSFGVANRTTVDPGSTLGSVALADLDSNGVIDVLAGSSRYGDAVSVLFGRGDGSFEPPRHTRFGINHAALAVSDFDSDGRADIAVMNGFNYPASVLFGSGGGSFEPARALPGGTPVSSLAVGDVDRDGTEDIVALRRHQPGIVIWLGGDLRGSVPGIVVEPSERPTSFTLGDLNQDSYPDLITADRRALRLLTGNGRGRFALLAEYDLCSLVEGCRDLPPVVNLVSRDLDSDELPDLLAVGPGARLHVFHGTADGQLLLAETHRTGFAPKEVVVEDFNEDALPDLAVPASGSSTIEVLLGLPSGTR